VRGGQWLAWAETANKTGEEMEWPAWVPVGRVRGGSGGGLLGVASAMVLRVGSLPATGRRWLVCGCESETGEMAKQRRKNRGKARALVGFYLWIYHLNSSPF